jgi:D-alanyl-D-alanine carboxypeptidase (penicillin-binding protein 5/6)
MFCLPRTAAALIVFLAAASAFAQAPAPMVPASITTAPIVEARAWILYDRTAGQILAESNPDIRWEPASLTKLMTAYLVLEAVRDGRLAWQQPVEVPQAVRRVGNEESRMYLAPGNRLPLSALMGGLLVVSANDAALTLARAVDADEDAFVARMNATAARLGMAGTHFNNPSGIPGPTHYTTAADLLRLTLAFDRDFPQIYELSRQQHFAYQRFQHTSTNRLLALDPTVDGLKTGHTRAAGYNIVVSSRGNAAAGQPDRGFIVVLLGAPSRTAQVQSARTLLTHGTTAFHLATVLTAGEALQHSRVYGSAEGSVALGVEQTRILALPSGMHPQLRIVLDDETSFAPLPRGSVIGHVEAVADEQVLLRAPLVTLEAAEPASWPIRFRDSVALLFGRWFG